MQVEVLFFAVLRERVGLGAVEWPVEPGTRVGQLWRAIVARYPALEPYAASTSFAVNREYVDAEHVLLEDDEVAFIPPVSGG